MLLSAVHHHRTCSAKQMWPTQEVLLKYTSAYTELFRIICIHLQVLLNVILPQQFFVLHVQNFATQNYLLSTVYQGAYKLVLFYNKEQLFSHVLQFNIFHHKLKFSFNCASQDVPSFGSSLSRWDILTGCCRRMGHPD